MYLLANSLQLMYNLLPYYLFTNYILFTTLQWAKNVALTLELCQQLTLTDHPPYVKTESFCYVNCRHQIVINYWHHIDVAH